ncbi:MAG: hypothetical protein ACRC8A_13230 [Microcoleaceae cyanobacterium]
MSKIVIRSGALIKEFAPIKGSHTIRELADGIAEMIENILTGGIKEARFEFDLKVIEEEETDE